MDGKFFQNVFQKSSKLLPNFHKTRPKIVFWAWFWVPWKRLGRFAFWLRILSHLGGLLGRLGQKKVAIMVPTWFPKREQHRPKIEAKSDPNFDASWGRFFERFWWIWEAKMSQVGTKIASKIDPNFERRTFETKTCFP